MNMQPVCPPTAAGLAHKKRLYIVLIIHLVLSICLMFVSVFTGIFELINVLILWCATAQMHFCYMLFYIVMCLMGFIQDFAVIGLTWQQGSFVAKFR